MIDIKTHPIQTVFTHIGIHIGSVCLQSVKARDGYTFTVSDAGVLVESPRVPDHLTQPGQFTFVPWTNIHAVMYADGEPTTGPAAAPAPAVKEVPSVPARPKSKSR